MDDATDAAKNAAAIILTSPGLSAIYSAVVESRRIFRKLKAYVIYRFAATIQIVIVLTLVIFISDCPINSLFVILLALFNDLTMLPIAYDRQQASAVPENPEVGKMLLLSLVFWKPFFPWSSPMVPDPVDFSMPITEWVNVTRKCKVRCGSRCLSLRSC